MVVAIAMVVIQCMSTASFSIPLKSVKCICRDQHKAQMPRAVFNQFITTHNFRQPQIVQYALLIPLQIGTASLIVNIAGKLPFPFCRQLQLFRMCQNALFMCGITVGKDFWLCLYI